MNGYIKQEGYKDNSTDVPFNINYFLTFSFEDTVCILVSFSSKANTNIKKSNPLVTYNRSSTGFSATSDSYLADVRMMWKAVGF